MSKFCQNCGNMTEDNATFCDKCGKPFEVSAAPQYEAPAKPEASAAPQYEAPAKPEASAASQYEAPAAPQYDAPAAPQYEAPQYAAPRYGTATAVAEKKNPLQACLSFIKEKKALVIGGAVILVLVIVLIAILGSCASNSPKGVLQKIYEKAKVMDMRGAVDFYYDFNFNPDIDKEAQLKEIEEELKEYQGMVDLYKTMMKKTKLEIISDKKLDDDEVNSLKDSWSSSFKDTDKISEIHELTYKITGLENMGGSDSEDTCYAVKVGGKWYIKGWDALGIM